MENETSLHPERKAVVVEALKSQLRQLGIDPMWELTEGRVCYNIAL